ncbi:MAG: hypothetical protein IKC05_00430 [Lentisphaeria bacterium]|nr:hypothetical protein [Lentisphaeria bacterium]
MDKSGAPVFALTGYAVASHVIPRGFAMPLCGMARAIDVPVGKAIHAPPAAAQQTTAAMQNFCAEIYRRVCLTT